MPRPYGPRPHADEGRRTEERERCSGTRARRPWCCHVFAGFFVAQEKGYLKDEGLDVTINGAAQNLSSIQAVASKADVIGLHGGQSLMLARSQGIPVKAFGALFQKGPGCFIWLEQSGIRGLQ